ncbi:MAG: (d)CMP kinase [Clostridia bacterium]|jgi:cytidylate kinase|nr:(d)CMP kinase [Clostridia bacterium]
MSLNIAMDGPVGAGKSSVADAVAKRLGILHLDTGAMYRALGLKALRDGIDLQDEEKIDALCEGLKLDVRVGENGQETLLDGENVSGLIRTPEVSMAASTVSRYARVRKRMVKLQQELAASRDMILDGRDICTTVLPDADLKIYLTASAEERALRRWKEMRERGDTDSYEEVLSQVRERDEQDMNRPVEPLRQAEDAVLLDSTNLTFEQVIDRIAEMAEEVRHGN